MTDVERFLKKIERHIKATGMTATDFGKKYAHDPSFVSQLRKGREPRSSTRNKVLERMNSEKEQSA